MGSERDAVEFTARLMGKVPPAQLDTDLPPMPEADTTEEEMGLSPIPGSPPNSPGSPPRSPPVKRRPKRRATGMFSCCGSKHHADDLPKPPDLAEKKRKRAKAGQQQKAGPGQQAQPEPEPEPQTLDDMPTIPRLSIVK